MCVHHHHCLSKRAKSTRHKSRYKKKKENVESLSSSGPREFDAWGPTPGAELLVSMEICGK